ncbi:hypothetical protein OIV83_002274 [Microbotryomycetes sp. JL201]|nr:hypothetical protein OIV83_002274 [Microbotryomycetes sp. JL201]
MSAMTPSQSPPSASEPPHSSRPSPSKRALSSPDIHALTQAQARFSPRLARTKLSPQALTTATASAPPIAFEGPERTPPGLHSVTTTPPSPAGERQGFKGLGIEVDSTDTNRVKPPADSALEQQRRLEMLPTELHMALAKLSSQHSLSEYNRMKVAIRQPAPVIAPAHSPGLSAASASLNRSLSSPQMSASHNMTRPSKIPGTLPVASETLQAGPSRLQPQSHSRPLSTSFASGWPSLIRPVIDLAAAAASAASSALNSPLSSRPSTPLESPFSIATNGETIARSGLTPVLGGLSYETAAITPLEQPLLRPGQNQPAADVLRSALEETIAQSEQAGTLRPGTLAAGTKLQEPFLAGMKMINGIPVRTSVSHPINISHLVPPNSLSYFSQSVFAQHVNADVSGPSCVPDADARRGSLRFERPFAGDLWDIVGRPPSELPPHFTDLTDRHPHTIGNFMLSSCPGKKIRLDATALRGSNRNAICRDLRVDLSRARDQGVRLVICCLDDHELAFLGSPIDEYLAVVDELDMQLVRIPMVEGFAPASPQALDQELDRVIKECTLRGYNVLAHCRGGIGRAGLVACCWLIKMGIVGGEGHEMMREQPMRVVERVIDVIRRRRSIKAIETPVQVSFLLAYVAYLQQQPSFVCADERSSYDCLSSV